MTTHALTLCAHHSARSVLGEALRNASIDRRSLHSMGWDELRRDGAPPLSLLITVCDSAAAETCPVFFGGTDGAPVMMHWGYPDPSNAEGGDDGKRGASELTRQAIGDRMLQ